MVPVCARAMNMTTDAPPPTTDSRPGQARQLPVAFADATPVLESPIMSPTHFPKPHQPNNDVPEEFEPGVPPVAPDEESVPALVPGDPKDQSPSRDSQTSVNAKTARPGAHQVAIPPLGVKAPLSDAGLKLPNERDESTHTTAQAPDPMIVQAKRDIDAGMVDTDMYATPGLDAELRERLVPGPGGKPLASRG